LKVKKSVILEDEKVQEAVSASISENKGFFTSIVVKGKLGNEKNIDSG